VFHIGQWTLSMNDGSHFLDIVFFAMVAAFLVLRLRSVLGRRTGNERHRPEQWTGAPPEAKVIDLAQARRSANEPQADTPVAAGLAAIRAADPAFDLDPFLLGAKAAFEIIVSAFAAGDKAALRPLLAPEVYRQFVAAIDGRLAHGETLTTELIAMREVQLVDAVMEGPLAAITVRLVSDQVNALKDAAGRVVEGSADHVIKVVDEWTFRRDTRSSDPNWALAATRTPEEG
jgi:predicted lipid-binding transport protein (Tim44 family)